MIMKHPIDPKIDCVEMRQAMSIPKTFSEKEHAAKEAESQAKEAEPQVKASERVETEQQRWLKFFTEGESLDENHLPDWMQTDEMRQAMSTLRAFSEDERAYHVYQARQNYLREQRSIQRYIETLQVEKEQERAAKEAALQEKEAALQEKEAERQAKEAALAEVARLKALLRDS